MHIASVSGYVYPEAVAVVIHIGNESLVPVDVPFDTACPILVDPFCTETESMTVFYSM